MHWIESAGGPLLLLSEDSMGNWGGVLDLISRAAAKVSYSPGGKPTDYDSACSVEGLLGFIEIGTENAVVLGGESLQTAWVPNGAGNGGMFIRWFFGESEAEFMSWIDDIPEEIFGANEKVIIRRRNLILFDSAVAGRNVKKKPDEYLSIELEPGHYDIETGVYQPDDRTSMVVHRFKRL
jgi:hypothetical protein